MDGERDFVFAGRGENRGVLPAMFNRVNSFREITALQGLKEIGPRRIERVIGFGVENGLEFVDGRKSGTVFGNKPPERTAVTFLAQRSGIEGEVNVAGGFIP